MDNFERYNIAFTSWIWSSVKDLKVFVESVRLIT